MRKAITLTLVVGAIAAAMTSDVQLASKEKMQLGAWRQKVQLVWDLTAREMVRIPVAVWDPQPEFNRDFSWEPGPGNTSNKAGVLQGSGTLVWRKRGAANYDASAVLSVYRGQLMYGRPHGFGEARLADGSLYRGGWRDGVRYGSGILDLPFGDRIEANFVADEPYGAGTLIRTTGETLSGNFVVGKLDGNVVTAKPDGTQSTSLWVNGNERVEEEVAVWRVQSGAKGRSSDGGRGQKVSVGLGVSYIKTDNQYGRVKYAHSVKSGQIEIKPESEDLAPDAKSELPDRLDDGEGIPLAMSIHNSSGNSIEVSSAALVVTVSKKGAHPVLRANFSLRGEGCGSAGGQLTEPTVTLANSGPGPATDIRLSFNFTRFEEKYDSNGDPVKKAAPTGPFTHTHTIGRLAECASISMATYLAKAGVDTQAARKYKFACDEHAECEAAVLRDVAMGSLATIVKFHPSYGGAAVSLSGRIRYSFVDHEMRTRHADRPISGIVIIAGGDYPAECGDLSGLNPMAPASSVQVGNYQLKTRLNDYRINLALPTELWVHKARNLAFLLSADDTSFHSMVARIQLGNGDVISSPPISLYYYKGRKVTDHSTDRISIEPSC